MMIIGEKGLSGFVKLLMDVVFWGGIGIYALVPLVLNWYFEMTSREDNENYYFLLIFLYVTGFFALMILNETRKIFKTLNRHNPFMMDNVKSLKRVSIACFVISAAYIVKMIFYNSIFTMIVMMGFIIAGLFAVIISEVFKQAVEVKEENDLTI